MRFGQRGVIALAALLVAAAIISVAAESGASPRPALRIAVVGNGTVTVSPGSYRCRKRCLRRFARGVSVRIRAQPAKSGRFSGWSGACSGRAGCTLRMTRDRSLSARFRGEPTLVSWNEHVDCKPVVTTIPAILGPSESPLHGATEAGGQFQPHLQGFAQQHLLNPPCAVGGTPSFVELRGVVITDGPDRIEDGDNVANVTDPNRPDIGNPFLKTIHIEIDGTWFAAGVAPAFLPPRGTKIDVQGFVFWDPAHVDAEFHSFSGWELHPVSAWRRSSPSG